MTDTYTPPEVWTLTDEIRAVSGSNLPTAGAQFAQDLPVGKHPHQLYSMGTPNGVKVTVLFEELLALGIEEAEYDAWPIRIGKGDQFGSGFVALNPNSKIPALMDHSTPKPTRLFESGAILLYLAEKFDQFLTPALTDRPELLSWLFWQMGAAPYVGGGFGHFYAYAPASLEYPINRFAMETKRQLDVLDKQLADKEWIAGGAYTIADIAIWAWHGQMVLGRSYNAATFLQVESYQNVLRWARAIDARPAVQRGRIVNRFMGDPSEQLHERHDATDFDTRTQDRIGG